MAVSTKPGHMVLARMPCVPYSMAAALVTEMTPAFDAEYAAVGRRDGANPVLGAEHHPGEVYRYESVALLNGEVRQGGRPGNAGHVEHGVHPPELTERSGEHCLYKCLIGDIDLERNNSVTERSSRSILVDR